ncbi:hypothetical protein H6A07_01235 [Olsenella uli]|uniref:hypothetical protein n=1 Tax=Olsenella uli TaxID=133926 RepID=UPI00195A9FB5|nr:hypothetical protein [Olsenella uli]MBM6675370.1 hypothetical protein [Olsenella uli]
MSEKVDRELGELFAEAEARGACMRPETERIRAACARRANEDGELVSPAHGLYARRAWWEALGYSAQTLAIMRSLQRAHPNWVFCGPSAALALGCEVPYAWQRPLHVMLESGSVSAPTALMTHHRLALNADDARERPIEARGLRVTPPLRTTLDSLRWMSFREGMVVADWAMGARGVAWRDFVEYAYHLIGSCRGVKSALSTFARATGLAESGGESIARAVMIEEGYLLPAQQVEVPDPLHPGRTFRVDFVWVRADGRVIVGECDGLRKLLDPTMTRGRTPQQVLLDQRKREGLITAYDVSVLRFTYEEAAGVSELVSKLELYGVPRLGSPLAPAGPTTLPDWSVLLRR